MSVVDDDTIDLLGKVASDLMTDVVIEDGKATGTLNYITDYTGFSGDPEEQEGNYIALQATVGDDITTTAELIGGIHGPVTLDSDGILVARITDSVTAVKFTITKGTDSNVTVIDLSELTLASE